MGQPFRLLAPGSGPDRDELSAAAQTMTARGLDEVILGLTPAGRLAAREQLAQLAASASSVTVSARQADRRSGEHDRYFGVTRVTGDRGLVFLCGLLIAQLDMLDHVTRMGTSLTSTQWQALVQVPAAMSAFARGHPADRDTGPDIPPGAGRYLPHERWRLGHRSFFTLIQALSVAVEYLLSAQSTAQERDAAALAARTARGCAAAMQLAADFDPADYAASVRPTMAPPRVGPGFSGLQTRDHRHLIRVFRRLAQDRPQAGTRYRELIAAVHELYAAHVCVCRKFGGDHTPSLLMATRSGDPGSGAQVAAELAAHRLAVLDPAAGSEVCG